MPNPVSQTGVRAPPVVLVVTPGERPDNSGKFCRESKELKLMEILTLYFLFYC